MSDFSSMNTTQLMIEANRLRKKLKKRRGGFGFDNRPNALSGLFGNTASMGGDLAGRSVMGAIARGLDKSRNRYDALMAELKKRKGDSSGQGAQNQLQSVGPQTNLGIVAGKDPNDAFTTSSNVTKPLMPQLTNQQQIRPGETDDISLYDGTENLTQAYDPNAQKGFISPEQQFSNANSLNPLAPPNPFDPDSTGINSLYNAN